MTAPLLTTRHVAELLGVSTETVLRWMRRGAIPAIRTPGGQIRFRPEAIDAWLAERATPTQGVLTTEAGAAQPRPYPATLGIANHQPHRE